MPFTKGHPPSGGRPKGSKSKTTIAREMTADAYRQAARERLQELQGTQFDQATGLHIFQAWDGHTKEWRRLTDPDMITLAMNTGEQGKAWRIYTKEPDAQMSKYLTDQAIGKAPETQKVEVSGPDGGPVVYTWKP